MDWKEANEKLTGRCKVSRKLQNNTYLERRDSDGIAVRLHGTDVITFHKNGDITLNTGGWNTVTTKERINGYQPHRVASERGQLFFYKRNPKYVGWAETPHESYYTRVCAFSQTITITKRGKVTGGQSVKDVLAEWREQDRESARVSRWLSRARGTKRVKNCGKRSWECKALQGRSGFGKRLAAPGEYPCGCVIERWVPKTKLTVSEIMAEQNISVRMAMAHVYGLERFLLDAGAKTIDTNGEYSLLDLEMGGTGWNKQAIRALKMTCPSTGVVYISPVEPRVDTVAKALDWYFQTEDYLGSVTQAS